MKKKIIFIALICLVVSSILFCEEQLLGSLIFGFCGVLIGTIAVLFFILNERVKQTNWYKNVQPDMSNYPDNEWYRSNLKRNYVVANVGSSSAVFAFDYKIVGVDGFNWAMQPQSMEYSFKILKTYSSIIRKNGYIIIPFSPFSALSVEGKWPERNYEKYTYILDRRTLSKPYLFKSRLFPLLVYPKRSLRALFIRDENPSNSSCGSSNLCTTSHEFEVDAKRWVDIWKKEFHIDNLDDSISVENEEGRKGRVSLFKEMINYCVERSLKPVLVLPPVHPFLYNLLTTSFRDNYIYSFINEIVDENVVFLDYMNDVSFAQSEYYNNAFFLNKEGAKIFTVRVLKDLGVL